MWLPTDERRLLAGYSRTFGADFETRVFQLHELAGLLYGKAQAAEYGYETKDAEIDDFDQLKSAIKRLIVDRKRVEAANQILAARKLISLERHSSERIVVIVGLTLEGYDLGRRYSSWFTRSDMWFREYKDHWLLTPVARLLRFVAGAR
jgi:hypothetical protein